MISEKNKSREQLILRVNELHHDFVDNYHETNKIMHSYEARNWDSLLQKFQFKDKKILEIGTGTGFVPLHMLKRNVGFSTFTCTDISQKILSLAEQKITQENVKHYSFSYVKLEDKKLPFKDNSYDIIVMNSVLHHLPDIDFFYHEASRVLKNGGLMVIAHEPNRIFYRNVLIYSIFSSLSFLFSSLGKIKLFILNKKPESNAMVKYVNTHLIKEKLIAQPLSSKEISQYIDVQVQGINYLNYPKFFKLVLFKSSNYLGSLGFSYSFFPWNLCVSSYNYVLSKIANKSGMTYTAVYKNNK